MCVYRVRDHTSQSFTLYYVVSDETWKFQQKAVESFPLQVTVCKKVLEAFPFGNLTFKIINQHPSLKSFVIEMFAVEITNVSWIWPYMLTCTATANLQKLLHKYPVHWIGICSGETHTEACMVGAALFFAYLKDLGFRMKLRNNSNA